MHGAFCSACANKSLTLAAPTPTNISTNSEPLMLKKGTFASPATAFARSVLPVPVGPTSRTPFGILPPSLRYLSGCCKKSITSFSSSFASSTPATSLKVTPVSFSIYTVALLLPTAITPGPALSLLNKNLQTKTRIIIGITHARSKSLSHVSASFPENFMLFFSKSLIKSGSSTFTALTSFILSFSFIIPLTRFGSMKTSSNFFSSTIFLNSL